MEKLKNSFQDFKELNCCVLIPTYNNETTIAEVIESVLEYTSDIIVVNDGSTDSTSSILSKFTQIESCEYANNRGKGYALRTGFKHALSLGYDYAISIDSDGQHYAEDLEFFINALKEDKNSLIIGSRNLNQEGVPTKSNFGNRFSNFWVRLVTGYKLPDTQSGYRLYPIRKMEKARFFTTKYEFEIEVLAKAAWRGVDLKQIPIGVFYPKPEDRVSHFRPFKDFFRISLLNTYLVTLTLLFFLPKRIFLKYKKKGIKQFIKEDLLGVQDSNLKIALAISFGFFMGIVPVWGYQLLIGLALAHWMKINKSIFFVTANISIPPMIPFILFASFYMGGFWFGDNALKFSFSNEIDFDFIFNSLWQYVVGAFTLATLMGIGSFGISYVILRLVRGKR